MSSSETFVGRPPLNRDTTVCISLSGRPSNHGIKFHNYLYEKFGLDFLYKAMTTTDIKAAIGGVRALGIRGCSVSMPFKKDVIPLMDEIDHSAEVIGAVNTIVNTDGYLHAYNTDLIAVASLLKSHTVDPSLPFALRGSGGMAAAVAGAFFDAGFTQGTIIARNEEAGRALATKYGYEWVSSPEGVQTPVIVNVTPIGMAGGAKEHELSFPQVAIDAASIVFDVVAMPVETPLIQAGRAAGKEVITGGEVIALQAAEQFRLYTGVEVSAADVEEAEAQAS
ncbi:MULTISPECIES: shikimate 5-dehydrogenase [unclassified Rothia (in: high G+C Gram-positive bacteria)]|uniref:shikimate 5-dehydrogenase n=1 Tax=unclassified Rothia (in: high G+C Gram-positive bacteria) TaxID=2689056 RepID=UPI00195BF8A6|nr:MULTISPECIES: shikimate 5-dehydrogenase [unclassified Rothia (in: high G+C Gram-positive bacteria)]MBM7051780.1 shikimate 5-dehydrogenase [Rothia sp. ZJ1223]QRZ61602.1 shikimate 5-dehydrogenase [Rothia sp. ZJ932]